MIIVLILPRFLFSFNPHNMITQIILFKNIVDKQATFIHSTKIFHYRHLLIPTLEAPANQGSRMKTHLNVVAPFKPSLREGLSCKRNPLRNQCTICLSCPLDSRPVSLVLLFIYLAILSNMVKEIFSGMELI